MEASGTETLTEEQKKLVEECNAKLGEHFDAVQILVSWNEEGRTNMYKLGSGNWYARQGMAHDFINTDVAQEYAHQLGQQIRKTEE